MPGASALKGKLRKHGKKDQMSPLCPLSPMTGQRIDIINLSSKVPQQKRSYSKNEDKGLEHVNSEDEYRFFLEPQTAAFADANSPNCSIDASPPAVKTETGRIMVIPRGAIEFNCDSSSPPQFVKS